ncbi:large ribosomal subunit protein mL41-like [Physella acuta]|uniref:large ribosomal subunit protein mL41-like n=1 Tax=Physella acuta TaxID=109671 RepID=UPI0027DC9038|nr:large ribosomal subunit protein mL41-like [Physella acuta]
MLPATRANIILLLLKRNISTSTCLCGAKTRKPWDERFPVRKEDVSPDKRGGSRKMAQVLPENIVAPTGVYHRVTKKYIHVPEMVPEFVVPDLTGFELKPYVSYKAKEITQLPLSPQDIFNTVYAEEIKSSFEKGELKIDDNNIVLADGKKISIDQ